MAEHDVRHAGWHITVALEFDDDEFGIGLLLSADHVIPEQVQIDGEPFRFGLIDQCNAMELSP